MPIVIANVLFFKAVWALSLYGVVVNIAWLGCLGLFIFLCWHAYSSKTLGADLLVVACAVSIGVTLDTMYLRSGLISYAGQFPTQDIAPLWIVALWANFALTLNCCLRWLQTRLGLAALLGFVCGPVSYFGGITLGTATVTGNAILLYALIGIAWAVTVPLLLVLAERFAARAQEPIVAIA